MNSDESRDEGGSDVLGELETVRFTDHALSVATNLSEMKLIVNGRDLLSGDKLGPDEYRALAQDLLTVADPEKTITGLLSGLIPCLRDSKRVGKEVLLMQIQLDKLDSQIEGLMEVLANRAKITEIRPGQWKR